MNDQNVILHSTSSPRRITSLTGSLCYLKCIFCWNFATILPDLIPGQGIMCYHTSKTAEIKIKVLPWQQHWSTTSPCHFNFIRSVKTALLKSLGGLWKGGFWVSLLPRPTEIKPSLQNKRHRLKRKQQGAKKKLAHIFISGPAQQWTGLQSEMCRSEKTGYQTFTGTIFRLSHFCLLLSPSPGPISHSTPMGHFL